MMKTIYCLIISLSLILQSAQGQSFTFDYNGTQRSYILHLPAGYTENLEYPLVFNFHGLTQSGAQQQTTSGMDAVADANGFIVVYPDGLNNSWNAGINNEDVDDVGFINALLDHLLATYSVDQYRVYSTGFSMGGYFSYRLACEMTDRIAAIAPVSGLLAYTVASSCSPTRDIPVLHFHGTSDRIVSYNGTYSLSVEETLVYWRANNECTSDADTIAYPNIYTADGSTVDLIRYDDCISGSEVSHFKLYNEGHTWPGSPSYGANRDIIASEEIWDFFSRYSLPEVVTSTKAGIEHSLSVSPQPFTSIANVSVPEGEKVLSIKVTDLKGNQHIFEKPDSWQTVQIGENLTRGIYILYLITDKGNYISKLVKQ